MSDSTYYSIPLLEEGDSQDWVGVFNAAVSAVTESMVRNLRPDGTTLYWGDVAGSKYLLCDAAGVKAVGTFNFGCYPTKNFVVERGAEFPSTFAEGSLFLRTDLGVLYVRIDGAWVALGQISSDAIASVGGLRLIDLGVGKGSFGISNGVGGISQVSAPGANQILAGDPESETGYTAKSWLDLAGISLPKGNISVGLAGGSAQAFAPGANGAILMSLATEDAGLAWTTITALLGTLMASRGQIVSGGVTGPVVTAAATSSGQVLTSDATASGGVKWTPQSDLGSLPGTRTRVGADILLYNLGW